MEVIIHDNWSMALNLPVNKVTKVESCWEINAHATLVVEGEIPYETAAGQQKAAFMGQKIEIRRGGQPVFHGLLKQIEFRLEGRTAGFRLEGISSSWRLDREKVSRSFPKEGMTYASLAKAVAADSDADVITVCGKETSLPSPLIQQQETDWEFLKRAASHLNQFLLCDVVTGRPAFWFGLRKGLAVDFLAEHRYSTRYNSMLGQTYYQVESRELYEIGDKVDYMGKRMVVCKRVVSIINNVAQMIYTLCIESALETVRYYNRNLVGAGLYGKVDAVSGEKVSIRLEMDQEKKMNHWYPWRPETGNVMYAMPEIGSPVVLTIPEGEEEDGLVCVCLHRETLEKPRKAAQNKRLKTTKDSAMNLYPGQIEFIRKDGKHKFVVGDEGIQFKTSKRLRIKAKAEITCDGKSLSIDAADEIRGVVES